MSRHRAPWTDRMYEILADGEWHSVDSLLLEMMATVEPGYATRKAEVVRERYREKASVTHTRSTTTEETIRIGKRRVVYTVISAAIRGKRVEAETGPSGNVARIRLSERDRNYVVTAELARLIQRKESTTSDWMSEPSILAEVRSYLPDGVEPVVPISPGSRHKMVPRSAIPAWQKVSARRRVLRTGINVTAEVAGAVGAAFGIEDEDEQFAALTRLRAELAKVGRAIYTRQD